MFIQKMVGIHHLKDKSMQKYIIISMLSLFAIALFCSYTIVKNKIEKNQPSFVITKTKDINDQTAKKLVVNYKPEKQYYWKFRIQKTYHSNGMRIFTSSDTLTRELKLEDK
jgi:hypothetical protein